MQGHGVLYCPPGEIIEANFGPGGKIQDGKIKILYTNGEYFEGDFKGSKRNGRGIHYFKNGDIYEGEFMNDKRVGKGKMTFKD